MRSSSAVELKVEHRLGSLRIEAVLAMSAAWTVLFGPSGSGKSTLLRLMAGLMRPDSGAVAVLGRTVVETERGVWVPAHLRPVRWAGQREALFPRMTVRQNVACGMEGSARSEELERALEVFGLRALAGCRPGALSGGQRQRVSVARAAVGARGKVLLLDEPFSGLDAGVRGDLIAALDVWLGVRLGETRVISVTHDVGEAFLLSAEVVRMRGGRVEAQGEAAKVMAEERERLRGVLG